MRSALPSLGLPALVRGRGHEGEGKLSTVRRPPDVYPDRSRTPHRPMPAVQECPRMSFITRPRTWAVLGLCLLTLACQRNESAPVTAEQEQPKKEVAKAEEAKKQEKASTTDWPGYRGASGDGISKE